MTMIMSAVLVAGLSLVGGAEAPVVGTGDIHCGKLVAPIGTSQESSDPVCFDTPAALDAYMNHSSSRSSITSDGSVALSISLGTLYEHSGYGGSSFTLYGTGSCAGASYGFASLGGGWDSRVSSARGLNGCSLTLYTAANYGGTVWNCGSGCSSLPGLVNDQVRSVIAR